MQFKDKNIEQIKITVLVEDTENENLPSAHGLSLYIETPENKILFDMGPNELFWENAEFLGIDLNTVDTAVISHGHYDHGGGLSTFLDKNKNGKVYINGEELEEDYLSSSVRTEAEGGLLVDFTVPEGTVFAMGDNRAESHDCRAFGCIPQDKIESIVLFRFWPFDKFGKVE